MMRNLCWTMALKFRFPRPGGKVPSDLGKMLVKSGLKISDLGGRKK